MTHWKLCNRQQRHRRLFALSVSVYALAVILFRILSGFFGAGTMGLWFWIVAPGLFITYLLWMGAVNFRRTGQIGKGVWYQACALVSVMAFFTLWDLLLNGFRLSAFRLSDFALYPIALLVLCVLVLQGGRFARFAERRKKK